MSVFIINYGNYYTQNMTKKKLSKLTGIASSTITKMRNG